MLDRLRRILGGPTRDAEVGLPSEARTAPGPLDWITETTPYRFRTWLADASQSDEAVKLLETSGVRRELTVTAVAENDGRVRLDLSSTFRGWAAITRALGNLGSSGVRVQGLEHLDIVEDVPADDLAGLVRALDMGPHDPHARRRMDAVAGEAVLRHAIAMQGREPKVRGWRRLAVSAAQRTAGGLEIVLDAALAERDDGVAGWYTGAAAWIGRVAELVDQPFAPDPDVVVALARRGGEVAEQAHDVARYMRRPLPVEVVSVLCTAARRATLSAANAVRALSRAPANDEVRAALEAALASTVLDVSDAALDSLAHVFGTDARPYWQAGLASSSAPRRMAAEDVIGQYGDADDVPLAAEHLRRIIRRRSSISWQPPRGSDIIGLLVRHRELPEAEAALADLTKRWPKLADELQQWLAANHPDLVPPPLAAEAGEGLPEESTAPAEPPLEWPLPSVERQGNELHLGFWDTDVTDIRDRFEDLAAAHPAVTIVDGDREWSTLRVDAADPEALVAKLWAQAQAASANAGRIP